MTWEEIEAYIEKQRPTALREIGQHAIDVEDVLQETRIRVWKAVDKSYDVKSIRTYIQRVIRNTTIDMKRKPHMARDRHFVWSDSEHARGSYDGHAQEQDANAPYIQNPGTTKEMDELEAAMMLDWTLDHLPENYHASFVGKLEGMPDKEIADNIGISLSAHKDRGRRARLMACKLWDTLKTN